MARDNIGSLFNMFNYVLSYLNVYKQLRRKLSHTSIKDLMAVEISPSIMSFFLTVIATTKSGRNNKHTVAHVMKG